MSESEDDPMGPESGSRPSYGQDPHAEVMNDQDAEYDLEVCGHDPSGGDCDYDWPHFAQSEAGF